MVLAWQRVNPHLQVNTRSAFGVLPAAGSRGRMGGSQGTGWDRSSPGLPVPPRSQKPVSEKHICRGKTKCDALEHHF